MCRRCRRATGFSPVTATRNTRAEAGAWTFAFRNLAVHDPDSGAVIWRCDRKELSSEWVELVALDPVVLITWVRNRGAPGYIALDPGTAGSAVTLTCID